MESRVPIEERRNRIRRWLRLTNLEHVIRSYDQGEAECFICKSRIQPRNISFMVVFLNGTISLRLDQGCMDLWCLEIASSATP